MAQVYDLPTQRYAGAFLIELDPTVDWTGTGAIIASDGSAWLDYTRLPVPGGTENRVKSREIADGADAPVRTLRATLAMNTANGSLSSGAVDSPFNLLSGSFSPALFAGRRVLVQDPLGDPTSLDPEDWRPRFDGHIDDHPANHAGDIQIFARDASARLMVPYTGDPFWVGTEGEMVALDEALQAILDGTTGAETWALKSGDEDLEWAIPAFQFGNVDDIYQAIRDAAQQRGLVVRYWPDEDTGRFQLTIFQLQADKETPDYTYGPDETHDIPAHGSDIASYRNDFRLRYRDSYTEEIEEIHRAATESEIASFGIRPLVIPASLTTHITTAEDAGVMLDSIEGALRVPAVVGSRVIPRNPRIEVNTLLRFAADARVSQEPVDLYVTSWTERETATESSTTVQLRGAPVGQIGAWLRSIQYATLRTSTPSYVVQFAEDAEGTGASLNYDPEIHTHTRHSYDGGATWSEWAPIVGTSIMDVHRLGIVNNELVYRVTLIDGLTARVYWSLYDNDVPEDWIAQTVAPGNLKQTITESGAEFTAPWPGPDQYLRGIIIPMSAGRVAGEGWEIKANGTEPHIGIDQPTFIEALDGRSTEFRVGIIDPRGVVTGVLIYLTRAGIQTGPFEAALEGGRYTYAFDLHPQHQISLRAKILRNDGGDPLWLGPYMADTDKVPGVPVVREVRDGASVTIYVDALDSDTATLWYREVIGGVAQAEVQVTPRGSDPRFGIFYVTASTEVERAFRVYGKNTPGAIGPYADVRIGKHNEFASEIDDVTTAINNLDQQLREYIEDGAIDMAEAHAIGKLRDIVNVQYQEAAEEYQQVYNHPLLTGTPKTDLGNAWNAWEDEYEELIDAIDAIVAAGTINSSLLATYDGAMASYAATIRTLKRRAIEAQESIRQAGINTAVDEVYEALGDLQESIEGAFRDGIITEVERGDIDQLIRGIESRKAELDGRYNALSADPNLTGTPKTNLTNAHVAFVEAHEALIEAIIDAIYDGEVSPGEDYDVENAFDAYYSALTAYSGAEVAAHAAIAAATATAAGDEAKSYADGLITPLGAIIRSEEEPVERPGGSELREGDTWVRIDTEGGFSESYSWDGYEWDPVSLDASHLFGTIGVGVLFVGEVRGIFGSFADLEIDEYGSLRSNNYDPGVAGLHIGGDGYAEFNNVVIRGTLDGADGTFRGALSAEVVDIVSGGDLVLRPGGLFSRANVEWWSEEDELLASIGAVGPDADDDLAIATFGVGSDISFMAGATYIGHMSGSGISTDFTGWHLGIGGRGGSYQVKVNPSNGVLFVSL